MWSDTLSQGVLKSRQQAAVGGSTVHRAAGRVEVQHGSLDGPFLRERVKEKAEVKLEEPHGTQQPTKGQRQGRTQTMEEQQSASSGGCDVGTADDKGFDRSADCSTTLPRCRSEAFHGIRQRLKHDELELSRIVEWWSAGPQRGRR